jgi:hypothetical protein
MHLHPGMLAFPPKILFVRSDAGLSALFQPVYGQAPALVRLRFLLLHLICAMPIVTVFIA